jgi:hypothetical protein
MEKQNQTHFHCEIGHPLQDSWLRFAAIHKSLFYTLVLEAWKVNIPAAEAKNN